MCWCIQAHGSYRHLFFFLSYLTLVLQTRNFNVWVGEITVNAKIRRFFQLKATSLSLYSCGPHTSQSAFRGLQAVRGRQGPGLLSQWGRVLHHWNCGWSSQTLQVGLMGVCILLHQHRSSLLFTFPSYGWPLGRFHSGCFCLPSNLTVFCQ